LNFEFQEVLQRFEPRVVQDGDSADLVHSADLQYSAEMSKTSADKFSSPPSSRSRSDPQGIPIKVQHLMVKRMVSTHVEKLMWQRKTIGPKRVIRVITFEPEVHTWTEQVDPEDMSME